MFGKLSEIETKDVLASNILGRIGCHHDGVTYIVPISYAYENNTIYCHTREGMKVNMMRRNPDVCFEVDEHSNMANWKSVIAWGRFEELTESDERNHALEKLVNRILPVVSSETTHLAPNWPFPPNNLNEIKGIVFRIKLNNVTGRYERYLHHEE